MSFESLKKQSSLGSLTQKLVKEVEKMSTPSLGGADERLWKPEMGKDGVGSAVIRFLPAPEGAQATRLNARVPDRTRRPSRPRMRPFYRRVLLFRAHMPGQGRVALRPLRPGLRRVLQGRHHPSRTGRRPA